MSRKPSKKRPNAVSDNGVNVGAYSLWLARVKLGCLELLGDAEEKARWTAALTAPKEGLASFLSYSFSRRSDANVKPSTYPDELNEGLSTYDLSSHFREYVGFYLTPYAGIEFDPANILGYEDIGSVVDRYLSLKRCLGYSVLQDILPSSKELFDALARLAANSGDSRLQAFNSIFVRDSPWNLDPSLPAIDAYTEGQ